MADHQMDEEVRKWTVEAIGMGRQPVPYQPRRQLFMAAAARPAGGHTRRGPLTAPHLRFGQRHRLLVVRVEPSLETGIRLAQIMQATSALHDGCKFGRNADALGDRSGPGRDRDAVPLQFDRGVRS